MYQGSVCTKAQYAQGSVCTKAHAQGSVWLAPRLKALYAPRLIYPYAPRLSISLCTKAQYIPMHQGSVYPYAPRLSISLCTKAQYIPMHQGSVYPYAPRSMGVWIQYGNSGMVEWWNGGMAYVFWCMLAITASE